MPLPQVPRITWSSRLLVLEYIYSARPWTTCEIPHRDFDAKIYPYIIMERENQQYPWRWMMCSFLSLQGCPTLFPAFIEHFWHSDATLEVTNGWCSMHKEFPWSQLVSMLWLSLDSYLCCSSLSFRISLWRLRLILKYTPSSYSTRILVTQWQTKQQRWRATLVLYTYSSLVLVSWHPSEQQTLNLTTLGAGGLSIAHGLKKVNLSTLLSWSSNWYV